MSWKKTGLLVLIIALAAFLRLYDIANLPPAAGYDQAAYGVDALRIRQGARPVFLLSNLGREAMFSYLVTLVSLVVTDVPVAVYVTSALAGILTVPAVYLVAHELLASEGGALARYGGLLSALLVAVMYWHLNWSRLGMRAILTPLFLSLTIYTLWWGLRTGRWWGFALAGVFLGLGMYTYQAFRIVPLLVVLTAGFVLYSRRSLTQRNILNLLLVTAIALTIFAPMGCFLLAHPGSTGRAVEAAMVVEKGRGWRDNVHSVWDHTRRMLLAYAIRGDQDPRTTLPGRPALNPFLALALVVGIGFSMVRLKKPLYPTLLAWLAVMSIPAALATKGAVAKRALGATPAVAMLIAIGCLDGGTALYRWFKGRSISWARHLAVVWAILIGTGLAYTGVRTYRDYFVVWAQDPDQFTHFEVGTAAVGTFVGTRPAEEQIYLSPVPADHPSVELYSGQREGIKTYHGCHCTVLAEDQTGGVTYVLVTGEDGDSLDRLRTCYPQGEIVGTGPMHYGEPHFVAYHVPPLARAQVAPAHESVVNWDDKVGLQGYDLDAPVHKAGETIRLVLYYRGLADMNAEYTVFTHLLGPYNEATNGPVWAGTDSEPCRGIFPTSVWEKGELVIDRFALPIPANAPPGEYQIEVGLYNWWTMERLPVLDDAGNIVADHVILGQVQVISG